MKYAVIVVGSHYSGKSKTINLYLKPELGISDKTHIFTFKGKSGFILSQSFEEAARDVDYVIEKYADKYSYLVLAARPKDEAVSDYSEAYEKLSNKGFVVHTVIINPENDEQYYENRAKEIITYLRG